MNKKPKKIKPADEFFSTIAEEFAFYYYKQKNKKTIQKLEDIGYAYVKLLKNTNENNTPIQLKEEFVQIKTALCNPFTGRPYPEKGYLDPTLTKGHILDRLLPHGESGKKTRTDYHFPPPLQNYRIIDIELKKLKFGFYKAEIFTGSPTYQGQVSMLSKNKNFFEELQNIQQEL